MTSVSSASSASVSVRTWPSSSIRVRCSPSGSITAPRWAPDARTRSATFSAWASLVEGDRPRRRGVGVHRQDVGTQLGQHVRHHERGRAVGVVDHDLEPGRGDGRDVDGALEGDRVVLEGPRREADVADLGGEDPPEVLPVEQPLDLALGVLGDVGAVGVEEADDDRLRVALDEPHGEATGLARRTGDEAGDRHGRDLEVHHVDARGVEPGHHRPLEHPGRAARVTRGDDGVALAQRGAVGHRDPRRELRA